MDALTIILLVLAFLAAAVFIGRAVFARRELPPATAVPAMPPPPAPTKPPPAPTKPPPAQTKPSPAPTKPRLPPSYELPTAPEPVNLESTEIARLRLKLINCFGGNEGAMTRSIKFEWGKRPHLSEKELLEKMLYDFGRKH